MSITYILKHSFDVLNFKLVSSSRSQAEGDDSKVLVSLNKMLVWKGALNNAVMQTEMFCYNRKQKKHETKVQ